MHNFPMRQSYKKHRLSNFFTFAATFLKVERVYGISLKTNKIPRSPDLIRSPRSSISTPKGVFLAIITSFFCSRWSQWSRCAVRRLRLGYLTFSSILFFNLHILIFLLLLDTIFLCGHLYLSLFCKYLTYIWWVTKA